MGEVTCEGRFPEIREELENVLELVKQPVTPEGLAELHDLMGAQIHALDPKDNYFHTNGDTLRLQPPGSPEALVPLVAKDADLSAEAMDHYLNMLNASDKISSYLSQFHRHIELSELFPFNKRFVNLNFSYQTNFGIGHRPGERIVSDSPFSVDVRNRIDGVTKLSVGFWYRKRGEDDVVVVDQIQEGPEAYRPQELGVIGLQTVVDLAEAMGMNEVWSYPAKRHPMFRAYPDRKVTKVGELKKLYDEAAIALGFEGDPNTYYVKSIE
ncbi:MAG: hypothetical protein ACE5FT_06460 [Candidatus Nanoarchaeia archaeon]